MVAEKRVNAAGPRHGRLSTPRVGERIVRDPRGSAQRIDVIGCPRWVEIDRDVVRMPKSWSRSGSPFELGDRVCAAEAIGGFFRPKVAAGTAGLVIGVHLTEGRLTVGFINGHTASVGAEKLNPLDPSDAVS